MTRFLSFSSWTARKHRRWVHPALYMARSTVPGGGSGVYAARDISKGSHLGYYCGRVFWTYPQTNKRDWAYMMAVSRRPPWIPRAVWMARHKGPAYVDGTNMLSRVNCCRGGYVQNVDFTASGRFVTVADIKAGDELFICYGDEYWADR